KAELESAPTGVVPTLGTQNPKYVSAEPWPQEPFMKLKLVAAISALAIPALAHAQQSGPQLHVPKPTKADAQNVVQIRSGQSGSAKRHHWISDRLAPIRPSI